MISFVNPTRLSTNDHGFIMGRNNTHFLTCDAMQGLPIRTRACLRLLSYAGGGEELARARAFTQMQGLALRLNHT